MKMPGFTKEWRSNAIFLLSRSEDRAKAERWPPPSGAGGGWWEGVGNTSLPAGLRWLPPSGPQPRALTLHSFQPVRNSSFHFSRSAVTFVTFQFIAHLLSLLRTLSVLFTAISRAPIAGPRIQKGPLTSRWVNENTIYREKKVNQNIPWNLPGVLFVFFWAPFPHVISMKW